MIGGLVPNLIPWLPTLFARQGALFAVHTPEVGAELARLSPRVTLPYQLWTASPRSPVPRAWGAEAQLGDFEPDSACAGDDEEQDSDLFRARDRRDARDVRFSAATHAHRIPTALESRRPSVHYYETNSSLRARLVESHTASNIASSPRRRRVPRIERARRMAFVMRPAARAPCRARSAARESAARRRPPHAEPSSPVAAAPCVACDRHAASRKPTVAPRGINTPPPMPTPAPGPQTHGSSRRPVSRRNQLGALPQCPVVRRAATARPARRRVAPGFSAKFLQLRPTRRRPRLVKREPAHPHRAPTLGHESPPQAAHAQHTANARLSLRVLHAARETWVALERGMVTQGALRRAAHCFGAATRVDRTGH
ncbi:hypothetical protein B0H15DRAFT_1027202, partial [Mycena belliarum]